MTVRQAAERLEISLSLTYALLSSGKLRGTRHGLGRGTWRISDDQLAEYLRATEFPGGQGPPRDPRRRGSFTHLDAKRLAEAWKDR